MPFSSVLGASSVIKPGVCTSTTRPSVPYTGQLIYETDTASVASWNGSAWVYTHSSGLVLVKSQTIGSAVASVTVTGAFSSTYDNYLVTVSGGVGSTAQAITMQLGSTTTGYYYGALNVFWTGTTAVTNGNNAASIVVGFSDTSNNGAWINVRQPNLAKPTIINNVGSDVRTSGGASYTNDGFESSTTQHTAFTLAVTGTMTGGTIRVYGYRN